jgi:hypothetical protein
MLKEPLELALERRAALKQSRLPGARSQPFSDELWELKECRGETAVLAFPKRRIIGLERVRRFKEKHATATRAGNICRRNRAHGES